VQVEDSAKKKSIFLIGTVETPPILPERSEGTAVFVFLE
jgi:hypothetical protein